MDFLNDEGKEIYKRLEKHCKEKLKMEAIDSLEMSMLAHSFALYFETARFCSENGVKMVFDTEKGSYEQIRPEYTVMKNEYQNILKHGAKFALNPVDRDKIFSSLTKQEGKKKGFELGDMKVTKTA